MWWLSGPIFGGKRCDTVSGFIFGIPILGVDAPGRRLNLTYILTDSTVSESPLRVPSTVTSCPAWGMRVSGLVIL
jgi:hypothetical protein